MAKKRFKMSKGKSKRDFKKKSGFHPRNVPRSMNMRGGIRF
jgi:hypothetical protein